MSFLIDGVRTDILAVGLLTE